MLLLSFAAGAAYIEASAITAAIQFTEIYEFVQWLGNKDYQMPFIQVWNQDYEPKTLKRYNFISISFLVAALQLQIPSPAVAAGGWAEHQSPGLH